MTCDLLQPQHFDAIKALTFSLGLYELPDLGSIISSFLVFFVGGLLIGVFIGVWSGVELWDKGSGRGVLAAVLQGLSLAALAGCRCFGTLLFEGKVALDVKGPWDPA